MLKRLLGSRLTGIGTDRLIEEPRTEKSVQVPVPVSTLELFFFYKRIVNIN